MFNKLKLRYKDEHTLIRSLAHFAAGCIIGGVWFKLTDNLTAWIFIYPLLVEVWQARKGLNYFDAVCDFFEHSFGLVYMFIFLRLL